MTSGLSIEAALAIAGGVVAIVATMGVAFMKIGALMKANETHERELEKLRPVVHTTSQIVAGLQGHALAADVLEQWLPRLNDELRLWREEVKRRTP